MGFYIKDIFNLNMLEDSALVAGFSGMNNEVVWVNMMEILDSLDSLQRGELLITTGYKLDDESLYKNLIPKLYVKGLAGIGIQPGYYIDEIPKYIIETGNQYGFPVIKIPEKITFSHVTRTILKNIYDIRFTSNPDYNMVDNTLSRIITKNEVTFEDKKCLENALMSPEGSNLYVLVFSIAHIENGIIAQCDMDTSINKLSDCLKSYSKNILVEKYSGKILVLFSTDSAIKSYDIIFDLQRLTFNLSSIYRNLCFTIGLSNNFLNYRDIVNAYNEALSSQQALEKIDVKRGACLTSHSHLLKFLGLSNSKDHALKFVDETLNPIIKYDKKHKGNYLNTLKVYLMSGCNMNLTSEKLFIHRHTLRYRLEKISELCSINLEDYNSRLALSIAFYIYELYSA